MMLLQRKEYNSELRIQSLASAQWLGFASRPVKQGDPIADDQPSSALGVVNKSR